MREIRFRVFDLETGAMHICGNSSHDSIIFIDNEAQYYNLQNGCGSWGKDKSYELMQFTGLYDKAGTPIYEGDILRKDGCWDVRIEFEFGTFWVRDLDSVRYNNRICNTPISDFNIESFEVIGNIYESPTKEG